MQSVVEDGQRTLGITPQKIGKRGAYSQKDDTQSHAVGLTRTGSGKKTADEQDDKSHCNRRTRERQDNCKEKENICRQKQPAVPLDGSKIHRPGEHHGNTAADVVGNPPTEDDFCLLYDAVHDGHACSVQPKELRRNKDAAAKENVGKIIFWNAAEVKKDGEHEIEQRQRRKHQRAVAWRAHVAAPQPARQEGNAEQHKPPRQSGKSGTNHSSFHVDVAADKKQRYERDDEKDDIVESVFGKEYGLRIVPGIIDGRRREVKQGRNAHEGKDILAKEQ